MNKFNILRYFKFWAILTTCFAFISTLEADFKPGPLLMARVAAKRLKKMRENDHFDGADRNHDSLLDKKETEDAKQSHSLIIDEALFKKIDKNGDGKLSHEECEQFYQEYKEKKREPDKSTLQENSIQNNENSSDAKPKRKRLLPSILETIEKNR